MADGTQVAMIGILLVWIVFITGMTASVYTEQGSPMSGVNFKDYSFSESSQTDFSQISALNQTNIKILSGNWTLTGGNLIFNQNDYLLFIIPQPGKVAFTNLIGKNNQTTVTNTYTIYNPPGNNYEVIFLEGTDAGDKIKVKVDSIGFHLIELQSGLLIPWFTHTTDFSYPNPTLIQNAEITTEFHSDTGIIKFVFNNQEIFNQPTTYALSLYDTVLTEQRNYYGGLNSDHVNFSVSKIQYQTTVNTNINADPIQIMSIMWSLISSFNLPGLTTDPYGMLVNIIVVKIPTIILILLVALVIRSFFQV
jgi:hypothetical protein